jgi:hypothetical protein
VGAGRERGLARGLRGPADGLTAAHPDQGFDHLTDRDPGTRLEIPGYVRWADNGFGCLAVADERTGGIYDSYNHACLAVFQAVAEHGTLEAAEASEARRLGITPKRASGDVCLVATHLYQAGLLQPAREGSKQAQP